MKYLYITLLLFIVFKGNSQDTTTVVLNQITVSANIQNTELKQTGRNVSVITAKQIEDSPSKSIDGILQYALNVDVRSRSPFGVQSDIGIRGGHFDQTLILVDGVKMNDPQTGHHSLNLPISISEIERIEVLQGGYSRVFGPAAFSGVINIITKNVNKSNVKINTGVGQYGLYQLNGAVNLKKDNLTSTVSVDKTSSDGYAYNTAFKKISLYSKNTYEFDKSALSVQGGYLSNKFGASNFYHPKYKDQYEEIESSFINASLTTQVSNKFQSTFTGSFRNHKDYYDFNLYRYTNPTFVNYHKTNVLDLEWKGRLLNKFGKTSFGFEGRREYILSNRLGDVIETPIEVKNHFNAFYTKNKIRENFSGYFEHQISKNQWLISLGTLVNYNSQFGTKAFPGIDVSYALNENNTIYGSVNKSMRYPTFTEMYLVTSTVIGNPNVLPENAIGYEIGLKNSIGNSFTTLSLFYKDSKTAIDKVLRVGQATPTIENIANVKIYGVEISTTLPLNEILNIKQLNLLQLNYSFTNSNKNDVDFYSFYTLNYLRHKFTISNSIKISKKLNLGLNYTFKKRTGDYQLDATSPLINYKAINLVDSRVSWNNNNLRLFLDVNNLLNLSYFDFGFVEQPKRWVSIGLNLTL